MAFDPQIMRLSQKEGEAADGKVARHHSRLNHDDVSLRHFEGVAETCSENGGYSIAGLLG